MLNADLESFREGVRTILATLLVGKAAELETDGLGRTLMASFGAYGLLRIVTPIECGGLGYDLRHSLVLAEELLLHGATGVGSSLMLQANTLCPLLAKYGNADIHERFLKPLLDGTTVGCLAITEPSGGSAIIDALQCRAIDNGDDWLVTGEKMFITNSPIADLAICLARTSDRPGAFGFTLIAVPINIPGVTVSERLQTLGLKSSPTGKLRFEACRVPKTNTIGGIGKGYIQFTDIIREERLMIAAVAVALARICLLDTINNFKGTLAAKSGGSVIRNELTRYYVDIEAAQSFINSVTARFAEGQNPAVLASAAKFHLVELAQRTIGRCLELRGLDASAGRYPLEQAYRDSRVWSVYAGTSETMRDHVGRYLLPAVRSTI